MAESPQRLNPGPTTGAEQPEESGSPHKNPGKLFGKFQLLGELGRGGMGIVLEARDRVLDRHVAIKLLPKSISSQPDALQRFLREARAAAKLHHPNVVAVYQADEVNGQYFIVMELVRGGSLQHVLKKGPLDWIEATNVLADACRGLEAAHQAGLVHRDIKPANLMRSETGRVKLSDFGLVRPVEANGVSVTGSGNLLGTPQYMSPEQCRSELADERSDIYSLGATYFALLTGRPPFVGKSALLVMNAHLWDPLPNPHEIDPNIPMSCAAIIQRAMSKAPEDRYASAHEMLIDLEAAIVDAGQSPLVTDLSWGIPKQGTKHPKKVNTKPTGAPVTTREPVLSRLERKIFAGRATVVGIAALTLLCAFWWGFSGGWKNSRFLFKSGNALQRAPTSSERSYDIPKGGNSKLIDALEIGKYSGSLPENAFRLPGMRKDQPQRLTGRESWSMHYPGISQIFMANSGDFLVVLTNRTSTQRSHSPASIHVWSSDGRMLLDEPLDCRITCGAISPDSRRLAIGGTDGYGVLIWNTKTWQHEPTVVPADRGEIEAVALSSDSKWLAFTTAAKATNAWELWDLDTQKQYRRSTAKDSGRFRAIGFAPEKEFLVVTGSNDGILRSWDGLSIGKDAPELRTGVPIATVVFSPVGSLIGVGATKYFALWSYLSEKRDFAEHSQTGDVRCVAFSPSGKEVYWGAGPVVQGIRVSTKQSVATISGFGGDVLSLACTPDSSRMFSASADEKLMLWWIKSGPN